jgi:hypothetical protein
MSTKETMFCDEESRDLFTFGSGSFFKELANLCAVFGDLDPGMWSAISTPQRNEMLGDRIVSVYFKATPPHLASQHLVGLTGRKFFLDKKWIYDKVYSFIAEGACKYPIPEGSFALAEGSLVLVYGQPGTEDLSHFVDVYFCHPDHKAVEAWAGKSLPEGAYSTYYAATFDTRTGCVGRIKAYTYSDQNTFSDWEVSWAMIGKKLGILPRE